MLLHDFITMINNSDKTVDLRYKIITNRFSGVHFKNKSLENSMDSVDAPSEVNLRPKYVSINTRTNDAIEKGRRSNIQIENISETDVSIFPIIQFRTSTVYKNVFTLDNFSSSELVELFVIYSSMDSNVLHPQCIAIYRKIEANGQLDGYFRVHEKTKKKYKWRPAKKSRHYNIDNWKDVKTMAKNIFNMKEKTFGLKNHLEIQEVNLDENLYIEMLVYRKGEYKMIQMATNQLQSEKETNRIGGILNHNGDIFTIGPHKETHKGFQQYTTEENILNLGMFSIFNPPASPLSQSGKTNTVHSIVLDTREYYTVFKTERRISSSDSVYNRAQTPSDSQPETTEDSDEADYAKEAVRRKFDGPNIYTLERKQVITLGVVVTVMAGFILMSITLLVLYLKERRRNRVLIERPTEEENAKQKDMNKY